MQNEKIQKCTIAKLHKYISTKVEAKIWIASLLSHHLSLVVKKMKNAEIQKL